MDARDTGDGRDTPRRTAEDTDPRIETSAFAVPAWAKDVGRWSWIGVGAGIVLIAVFAAIAATRMLVLAALVAVLLGGTTLPVVDRLERHHLPRWLAALLVVVAFIALAVLIVFVIVEGLIDQVPTINDKMDEAAASLQDLLGATDISAERIEEVKTELRGLVKEAGGGVAGAIGDAVSTIGGLLFGIFISINIGVWILIQGRQLGAWASRHMGPVPEPVAYRIIADGARFFRGYLWGSTIVGLFNAAVLGVGALVLGVPLAATIAVVAWITNYIPYFGAIISGAFAVLIALGAGGPAKAIPMLVLVILANGFLQTLISQFALGSALKLHPLVVLIATTAGGILFGAVGGVFAAPFTKIGLDAYGRMKEVGVFGAIAAPAAGVAAPAGATAAPRVGGPPGPDG
ncbi:MAG TPA: AI-2E family transporter [Thermoleophilia bacterium]|nr:AI-2E family transporter [Thermoleophilia bacterium]